VRPRLRAAARAWDGTGQAPEDLTLLALREQRLVLRLADRPGLIRRVLRALPAAERGTVRDEVFADRALTRLSAGWPIKRRFKTGKPLPARRLWAYYGAAKRRFGVSRSLLAAVNLVESQFGRLRNESVSGAQGPMQFMPATFASYGVDGDGDGDREITDPADAIFSAAHYLCANGAGRDAESTARAIWHYNHADWYVALVLKLAGQYAERDGG
jgi:membrane-bound lytic murein transglycosylase B